MTTIERAPDLSAVPVPGLAVVRGRRRSVDALRGLVLAVMLLTPPVRAAGVSPMLRHAPWAGVTVSDLVLPLFLFTSGVSLSLLLARGLDGDTWRRVGRRLLALLVLGLLYNAIGSGSLAPAELRLTGVLQAIGLSGFLTTIVIAACRALVRRDDPRVLGAVLAAGAVAWTWLMLSRDCWRDVVGCGPFHGLDLRLLGASHVYRGGGAGHDPEGIAAVMGLSLVVLAGYLAGLVVVRGTSTGSLLGATCVGAALVGGALALAGSVPIVKRVASPTWMALAVGVGLLLLVAAVCLLDLGPVPRAVEWTRRVLAWPVTTIGANALVVYMGEQIMVTALLATPEGGVSAVERWLAAGDPTMGAVLVGVGLLAFFLVVTAVMRALRWRVTL